MTKTVYTLFNEMIESLGQAEGCCSQMVHRTGHPAQFMVMREALALTKEGATKIAPHNILLQPKTVFVN